MMLTLGYELVLKTILMIVTFVNVVRLDERNSPDQSQRTSTISFSSIAPKSTFVQPTTTPVIDIDECSLGLDLCDNYANCSNSELSYVCTCLDGFSGDGFSCFDVNECAQGFCSVHALCVNFVGSYACQCATGYTGDGKTCLDLNECFDPGICGAASYCNNTDGSYYCTCAEGYRRVGRSCTDVNECEVGSHRCHANAICVNTAGSYNCTCKAGFTGDGLVCRDINECLLGSSRCGDFATCTNVEGSYSCSCQAGFTGDGRRCLDINECASGLASCSPNASCINQLGSFACLCKTGFSGNGKQCTDINECDERLAVCDVNARCLNTLSSYACLCHAGFTGNGFTCYDVNECTLRTSNCSGSATCVNNVGSYECRCNRGFQGNGFLCIEINGCEGSRNPCHSDALCKSTDGIVSCTCKNGYRGNGISCRDVDECSTLTSNCDANAACFNTIGSYECLCQPGLSGDGRTCIDVNECTSGLSVCGNNSVCTNTFGSHRCSCKTGYAGNGIRCQDINECRTGSTNCDKAAVCVNTEGSFLCACRPGWTGGGTTCTDINECLSVPCMQDCINLPGSYVCRCKAGFRLVNSTQCANIDECASGSHDCSSNANCFDTIGSFRCECRTGYRGDGKICKVDNFIPFLTGTETLSVVDDSFAFVQSEDGIPFDGYLHYSFYVCANGMISIGSRVCSTPPSDLGRPFTREGPLVIAPYWADIDLTSNLGLGDNKVYYHKYDRKSAALGDLEIISRIESYVRLYTKAPNFSPPEGVAFEGVAAPAFSFQQAIVATWYRVRPWSVSKYLRTSQEASFQLILTTDGRNTYTIFLYGDQEMMWTDSWLKVMAGYRTYDSMESLKRFALTNQELGSLDFSKGIGNTGNPGEWIFQLSDKVYSTATMAFIDWQKGQASQIKPYLNIVKSRAPDCPCFLRQAFLDSRYQPDNWNQWARIRCRFGDSFAQFQLLQALNLSYCRINIDEEDICLTFTAPFVVSSSLAVVTRCCYSAQTGALITSLSNGAKPLTHFFMLQSFDLRRIRESKFWLEYRTLAVQNDSLPFYNGCVLSSLCTDFEEVRPIPSCKRYEPPIAAASWGEPHITTLDGFQYTFNGLGDYFLLRSVNHSSRFVVQARTCKVYTTGKPSLATVFCAFAMTELTQPVIEIYKNVSTQETVLLVNGVKQGISSMSDYRLFNETYVTFTTLNDQTTMDVIFPSGNSISIEINLRMLQSTVKIVSDIAGGINGLLGNANGDGADDFRSRYGTLLPSNSTQETLYYGFGQTWLVNSTEVLFSLPHPELDPKFVPYFVTTVAELFNNNQTLIDKASQVCGGLNFACLFDYALTEDAITARAGQAFQDLFNETSTDLRQVRHSINGPETLFVTYGQSYVFRINATKNSTGVLTFFVNTNYSTVEQSGSPSVFMINNLTGEFRLNVFSLDISVVMSAVDEQGNVASLQAVVVVCHCENNGTCSNSSLELEANLTTPYMKFALCSCTLGWTGPSCGQRLNLCVDRPCFPGVACTSVYDPYPDAACAACPSGFVGDGRKCTDFDDCVNGSSGCSQICENTPGSFVCSCYTGFRLANFSSCVDIDECREGQAICGPKSSCVNFSGGYNCTCDLGYEKIDGNCTDVDECLTDPCQQICRNTAGSFACDCDPGFVLFDNGTCSDVNECLMVPYPCSVNAACVNLPGSHECSCLRGYTGNGTSCTDIDECVLNATNPCTETCVNLTGSFKCACRSGFLLDSDGLSCSDADECALGTSNCDANATCANTAGSYNCSCMSGFTGNGTVCSDLDECELSPDLCAQTCTNTPGSYQCSCDDGYILDGQRCLDVEECALRLDNCDLNARCRNFDGGFECVCRSGFFGNGTSCADVDDCENSNCSQLCYNLPGGYYCSCAAGYTLNVDAKTCDDINECGFPNNCSVSSRCVNTMGSYSCLCNTGFTHIGGECVDIDECKGAPSPCDQSCNNSLGSYSCSCHPGYRFEPAASKCTEVNECLFGLSDCAINSTCLNTPGSFVCSCLTGFQGDGRTCTDVNECTSNSSGCSQVCTNTVGSFLCGCLSGYTLQLDAKTCADTNECLSGKLCHVNAVCRNTPGSFQCTCQAGYVGNGFTCVDLDECVAGTSGCQHKCTNTVGSFICTCPPLYTLAADRRSCDPINPCKLGTSNCHVNATCALTSPGFSNCTCVLGFTGDGFSCVDVNECLVAGACDPNAVCENRIGSHVCTCKSGFEGSGFYCQDFNECLASGHGCIQVCNNTIGSYYCSCRSGFVMLSDFKSCENVNECLRSAGVCHPNAVCTDTYGSYSCTCKPGYAGDGINTCSVIPVTIPPSISPTSSIRPNAIKSLRGRVVSVFTSLRGYRVDESIAITADLLGKSDSLLYRELKAEMEISLLSYFKIIETTTLSVNVTKLSIGSIVIDYVVNFGPSFQASNSTLLARLNASFAIDQYRVSSPEAVFQLKSEPIMLDDVDECETGLSRCHAQAECHNLYYSYNCTCRGEYLGDGFTCAVVEKPAKSSGSYATPIIIVVVGLVVILLVLLGILLFRKLRKKKENLEWDDSAEPTSKRRRYSGMMRSESGASGSSIMRARRTYSPDAIFFEEPVIRKT